MPSDDIRYHLDSLSFSLDLDARQIVVSVALLTPDEKATLTVYALR
jgi:hypothetical protein